MLYLFLITDDFNLLRKLEMTKSCEIAIGKKIKVIIQKLQMFFAFVAMVS